MKGMSPIIVQWEAGTCFWDRPDRQRSMSPIRACNIRFPLRVTSKTAWQGESCRFLLSLPRVSMTFKKWVHDPLILGNEPIFLGSWRLQVPSSFSGMRYFQVSQQVVKLPR